MISAPFRRKLKESSGKRRSKHVASPTVEVWSVSGLYEFREQLRDELRSEIRNERFPAGVRRGGTISFPRMVVLDSMMCVPPVIATSKR